MRFPRHSAHAASSRESCKAFFLRRSEMPAGGGRPLVISRSLCRHKLARGSERDHNNSILMVEAFFHYFKTSLDVANDSSNPGRRYPSPYQENTVWLQIFEVAI